jgi:hypothetical protein
MGKLEPGGIEYVRTGFGSQLSVGVAEKLVGAKRFRLQPIAIFVGPVMVGPCLSITVTLKLQVVWPPESPAATHVTVVVPLGKAEPDGGEKVMTPDTESHSRLAA